MGRPERSAYSPIDDESLLWDELEQARPQRNAGARALLGLACAAPGVTRTDPRSTCASSPF